ncbi:MAG TPA: aminopeptidase P family protein [Acidobacteriota bacterium]|nr:aminopeptidase P family protein [Acidobacteriota bacterium]
MTSKEGTRTNWPEIYSQRRNQLRKKFGNDVILWIGHVPQARNYADETYPFRQNSHFLYYTGISEPEMAMLSFPQKDHDILFAGHEDIDDIVWSGSRPAPADFAKSAGIEAVEDIGRLEYHIRNLRAHGTRIHFLPPYQYSSLCRLASLFKIGPAKVAAKASRLLMEQVAFQRSIKSDAEVAEIEEALGITDRMHRACMAAARPGRRESEISAMIQAIALSSDRQQAFTPIVTVRGEVLHNHSYDNVLAKGQLLLCDSGTESAKYYASDITRTCPVGGKFSGLQIEIYQIVLHMQLGAISMIKPGVSYRDVHLHACRIMVEDLRSIGLMRGSPADAVEAGAHALFFPHGIGHMMGLDVHDMEDLGDIVGYVKREKRSGQFGLKFLRLSRPLEPGYVLTVEPGIYFIPALIDRWVQAGLHNEFINYSKLEGFRKFGGIRIEDDVLVTSTGSRVLGPEIPKTVQQVEEACERELTIDDLRFTI